MKNHMRNLFINIIKFFYEKMIHKEMTPEFQLFLNNFFYVGIGMIIASIISFIFNILGGRILGPSGFGEYSLIYSVSMFLYLPMILGIVIGMVKYNAEKIDYNRSCDIISTTCILVFIFTSASILVYYFFSSQLSNIFSISQEVFYLSVIFAVLFVFYTLAINILISLHKLKKYAIFQPIFSIILLLIFLIFILFRYISFKSMIFSMYISYGITGFIILIYLYKYLKLKFNMTWAKELVKYGVFAFIGGLSFILYTNIDKIMINRFMTVNDVGIYRAYILASETLVGAFLSVFITVFFPTISKYKDKMTVFTRINKSVPYFVGLGFPFLIFCEVVILKLFGSQYPIDLKFLIFFAIAGLIILINGFYVWLMNSVGKDGIKITALGGFICAIINISLNFILIPQIGILGSIIATIISYLIYTFVLLIKRNLFFNTSTEKNKYEL